MLIRNGKFELTVNFILLDFRFALPFQNTFFSSLGIYLYICTDRRNMPSYRKRLFEYCLFLEKNTTFLVVLIPQLFR